MGVQARPVGLDQLAERRLVAGPGQLDQLGAHLPILASPDAPSSFRLRDPRSTVDTAAVQKWARGTAHSAAATVSKRQERWNVVTPRKERTMADHKIGTREEWLAAREELLKREKEHTRLGDEIAQRRRDLPWVPVEKDYRFDTDEGEKSLADLFDGRSQLLVYHFMFGPSYQAGCPVNSSIADSLDGVLPHLHARDATLLLVSQAPLEKLQAYKRRMGWRLPVGLVLARRLQLRPRLLADEEQSREAVAQIGLPAQMSWTATSRRSSSRTPARRAPTSPATSPRAPASAPSSGTATTSTTRTRRRGADWSSS